MYHENVEKLKELLKDQRYYGTMMSLKEWDVWEGQPIESKKYMQDLSAFLIKQSFAGLTGDEAKYLVEYFKNYDLDNIEDVYQKTAIKNFIRRYDRTIKVPVDLQIEISKATRDAQDVWEKAYKNNDFDLFKPYMYKMFELKTKYAQCLDNSKNPFNVLVDSFDEGLDVDNTSKLFDELKAGIIPLIKRITDTKQDFYLDKLYKNYGREVSENVMLGIIKKVGYNTNRSKWTEKTHPCTMGVTPRDSRITTNFRNFIGAMFSFLHEMGHGIYNYSSNDEAIEYSLWGGIGGSMHESQSRFYEMIVGTSEVFWRYFYPFVQENIKEFADIDFDTYYKAINDVKPCLKRLDADELTYNLHPIIRYEIEKDYFDGKIKMDDIREVWNTKYQEYLGLTPKNDSEGVLQDAHWAMGYVGYFQSYTLGNIYDGQYLHSMLKAHPNMYSEMANGDFSSVNIWLYENIHQYGQAYKPGELIVRATGEELKSKYFVQYLTDKYTKLYNI